MLFKVSKHHHKSKSTTTFLYSQATSSNMNPNTQKIQPWKKSWPPQDVQAEQPQSAEQMNLQRSYGTHASNTKGKIFTIETKPKSTYTRLRNHRGRWSTNMADYRQVIRERCLR